MVDGGIIGTMCGFPQRAAFRHGTTGCYLVPVIVLCVCVCFGLCCCLVCRFFLWREHAVGLSRGSVALLDFPRP